MRIWQAGTCVRVAAPAKINLFLEILARRDDGFHELETVMVAVSLYDTVELTATDDGRIGLTCRVPSPQQVSRGRDASANVFSGLSAGPDNLVLQALSRLQRASGTPYGAKAHLVKRIPLQAGLGGGSSDAAAALLAANRAWKLNWKPSRLMRLAEELGSDVPFFLAEGAAICRGRGEQITRIPHVVAWPVLIAHPGRGLSTAQVYAHCRVPRQPRSASPVLAALATGSRSKMAAAMFNRLQQPAEALRPETRALQDNFKQWIGQGYQMTGSGAAYFGVCPSLRYARRAARWLRSQGWPFATAARTVAPVART